MGIDWSKRHGTVTLSEEGARKERERFMQLHQLAERYTELSGYIMYVHSTDTVHVSPVAECSGPLCNEPAELYRMGETGDSRYAVCETCVRKFIDRRS